MRARKVSRLPLVRRAAPVVPDVPKRPKIVPRGILRIRQARAAGAYLLPCYLVTLLLVMVAVELVWAPTSAPRRLDNAVTADAKFISEFAHDIGGYSVGNKESR